MPFVIGSTPSFRTLQPKANVDGPNFLTNLNATDLVKVWGIEFDPVSYENETRSFRRTLNLRAWCNEAYPTV
jgi:hypothetical protein